MSALAQVERHFDVALPRGYREWCSRNYTDCRVDDGAYLWVHEAEWIPPDEILERDLWRDEVIPGLIPFAFSGADDNWCWNSRVATAADEYEILFCWHDEELADVFAPTFSGWFYRNCLDYASGAFDADTQGIAEGRTNLRLWSAKLAEIQPGSWADHLADLAEAEPFVYRHPDLRASVRMFGFITAMEVDRIVLEQFGEHYVGNKVEWGWWRD